MDTGYRSPFTQWHQAAAVRTMPAQDWLVGEAGAWMPEDDGLLTHPLVRPCARQVAAGLLLASLGFTVALESRLISPVALDIAHHALCAEYGDEVVTDALRVHCDEGYHAVLAHELIGHVRRLTGARLHAGAHPFLTHVDQLAQVLPAREAPLVRFCAAVVSETLITKTLRDDWLEGDLRHDLRSFLHHHYHDEVRHSAFFSQLLQIVWPQWPKPVQAMLRPLWPGLVDAFLDADDAISLAVLVDAGIEPLHARRALADCAQAQGGSRRRRASAQLTFRALRRAGAVQGAEQAWASFGGLVA